MALLGITSRASVAGVMNGVPAAVFHRSVLRQHRFGPFKTQRLVICFRAFPVGGAVGLALGGLGAFEFGAFGAGGLDMAFGTHL